MPRSNIPLMSKRYMTTRKRNSFSRPLRSNCDLQNFEGLPEPESNQVYNRFLGPSRSIISDNTKTLLFNNVSRKIKARDRKVKQRMKKKQLLPEDVKPSVKKLKAAQSKIMKPRQNKHIIFLSDSEAENDKADNSNIDLETSMLNETANKENCEDDDDVIFVETPPAEIIEIEDNVEQSGVESNAEVLENLHQRDSSPDDFLDKAHINLRSKFDTEPSGSEYQAVQFLKPTSTPVDMSETGSVSSVSDVSTTIGMNVFKLVEFPQEKPNLFDDENMEKFREAITPKRSNKKQKVASNEEEVSIDNESLPVLSKITPASDSRQQRGRSIIKELVNDRAFELLSLKKAKIKKRKSREELSDNAEEDTAVDSDLGKKKKKKKNKKKETNTQEDDNSTMDIDDDNTVQDSLRVRSDLMEVNSKKTKKNKIKDFEPTTDEENRIKTKKNKKNIGAISDKNEDQLEVAEENHERKKKKNKRADVQETADVESNEEKRKKKGKKNIEELELDVVEDIEERKKKKSRKNSEMSEQSNVETTENTEEKRKKKNKKTQLTSDSACEIMDEEVRQEIDIENNEDKKKKKSKKTCEEVGQKDIIETQESNEDKKKKKNKKIVQEEAELDVIDIQESNEDKKKRKNKKTVEEEAVQDFIDIQESNEDKKKKKNKKIVEEEVEHDVTDTQENIEDKKKKKNKKIVEEEVEHDVTDTQENIEDKKKRKSKKTLGATSAISNDIVIVKVETEDQNIKDTEIISEEKSNDKSKDLEKNNTEQQIISDATDKQDAVIVQTEKDSEPKQVESEVTQTDDGEKNTNEKTMDSPRLEQQVVVEQTLEKSEIVQNIEKIVEPATNAQNIPSIQITDCSKKRKLEIETTPKSNEIKKLKILGDNVVEITVNVSQISSPESSTNDNPENVSDSSKNVSLEDKNNTPQISEIITNVLKETDKRETEISESIVLDNPATESTEKEPVNLTPETPMVVKDNEGNIDMKITSIFPNFAEDVEVDNFMSKYSTWNANPSRFKSYNDSLFNNSTVSQSDPAPGDETSVVSQQEDMMELSENVVNVEESNANLDDSVIMKSEIEEKEKDDEISSGVVTIKTEVVEESDDNQTISANAQELPNVIEEIVKEKDNLHTVKRLCEFLEEVGDPEDVLKKVSLLKQAYTEKSLDPIPLVQISHDDDDDDVVSISSSSSSSILLIEDDVSIIDLDDITLGNVEDTSKQLANKNDKTLIADTVNVLETADVDIVQTASEERTQRSQNNVVEILETAPKTGEKIETVKMGHEQEIVQSTPKKNVGSSCLSRSAAKEKKTLDKYEVEEIQASMSDNPRMWKIVAEDICPIRLPMKGRRCLCCKELGHLSHNCPNKYKLPKCSICGLDGHLDFRCPHKLCIQCGRKSTVMRDSCEYCRHYQKLTCASCGNKGHPKNKCPDMWRRYHLTLTHGPLVEGSLRKLRDKRNLWCSACAKNGHIQSECEIAKRKPSHQPLDPRIYFYEDVYKYKANTTDMEFLQPNLDEVPQSSQGLRLDESSSSGASTSSNEEKDGAKNAAEEEAILDLPSEGLQGLGPEFEVIDEVSEDNQNTPSTMSNVDRLSFFMSAPEDKVAEFLTQEMYLLQTSKFEIRNLHSRFFSFVEDDKKTEDKQKFKKEKKENFYKTLNMLLFGKLQVKCGRIHTDKLNHFVHSRSSSNVKPIEKHVRYSLSYSYDYIFRKSLHNQVNYKFFLKMIRTKFGNQKWLY